LPDCHLGECKSCPGTDLLKEKLLAVFDASMIDTITYKQWTAVDRSTLETVNQHSDDFVESFCEKLDALRSHSFIATQ
jgi:predicted RNA-binding protein with PIN domain